MIFLISDPLGQDGTDFFGTADRAVDYGVIGATTAWYYQVGFVVVGHVAALILAHDRALGHLRQGPPGGALPVLDAGDHGRLHQPRALAPGPVERLATCRAALSPTPATGS